MLDAMTASAPDVAFGSLGTAGSNPLRHDWTLAEVEALFALPFMELVFQAATVHRRWFDPSEVQKSQLLSIKTGGCAENCGYCSQSASFDTGLKAEKLMDATSVIAEAMEEPEVDRWGVVAMHFAAAHGHAPALRALRLEGIGYGARSLRGGFTPMHQAASGGHPDTIAFLLRRGQKWDTANDAGMTPADVLRSRHPGLVAQFGLSLGDNVRMIFPGRAKPKR